MQPHNFKMVNAVYVAPSDWDEEKNGPCDPIPVFEDNETETCTTLWRPDADELAKLNAGASIALIVCGALPPVALRVINAAA